MLKKASLLLCLLPSIVFAKDLLIINQFESINDNQSRYCFNFNANIENQSNLEHTNSLIKLYKDNKLIKDPYFTIDKSTLCIDKLDFDKEYSLKFQSSFAYDKSTLDKALNFNFKTSDAKANLYFENGLVLPYNDKTLDIYSINYQSFDIKIFDILQNKNVYINDYYYDTNLHDIGKLIYSKTIDVKNYVKNKKIKSSIDLNEFLKDKATGSYFIAIGPKNFDLNKHLIKKNKDVKVWQIKITDLSPSVFYASDNLVVSVRSLKTTMAIKNAKVDLIARNGSILESKNTNNEGYVIFDKPILIGKDGNVPEHLNISYGDDKSYISFNGQYLLKLPIDTIANYNSYNVFSYLDRNVYRPNQTVHFNALIRDFNNYALGKRPFILRLLTPNGTEFFKKQINSSNSSSISYDFKLPDNATRGTWSIEILNGNDPISSTLFSVSDFIANVLELKFNNLEFFDNKDNKLSFNAMFNYGKAASNLSGSISYQVDYRNIAKFKDYTFIPSDLDNYRDLRFKKPDIYNGTTDENGNLAYNKAISFETLAPAKLTAIASIIDTKAQSVDHQESFNIKSNKAFIGIRQIASNNNNISFSIISAKDDGTLSSQKLYYKVYQENTVYNYVYEDKTWKYVSRLVKRPIQSGKLQSSKNINSSENINLNLPDGTYVIELYNKSANTYDLVYTNYKFTIGYQSYQSNEPSLINLSSDKQFYQDKQLVKLSFKSPYSGVGNLIIGNKKIYSIKQIDIKKGENITYFTYEPEFGSSTYAIVQSFAKANSTNKQLRSLGIVHIQKQYMDNDLKLDVNIPDEALANQKIKATISAKNYTPGEKIYATIAIVDEGILSLGNFKSPDPLSLYKQKDFYINIYDYYNYVISRYKKNNQGYDALASSAPALAGNPNKSYVYYQGPIELKDGSYTLEFNVKNFTGALRAMVVAWSDKKLGQYEKQIIVKDKLIPTFALPRFIYNNDEIIANLILDNLSLNNNNVAVKIKCSGSIECNLDTTLVVDKAKRSNLPFKIIGKDEGLGKILVNISADNYSYTDSFEISSLMNYPKLLDTYITKLNAHESKDIRLEHQFKENSYVSVEKSTTPIANSKEFFKQIEDNNTNNLSEILAHLKAHLVSYDKDMSNIMVNNQSLNYHIQDLINQLLALQKSNGSFFTDYCYEDVEISSLLFMANRLNFYVPMPSINKALDYLQTDFSTQSCKAFAQRVLLDEDKIYLGDIRYSYDLQLDKRDIQALIHYLNIFKTTSDSQRYQNALIDLKKALYEYISLINKLSSTSDFYKFVDLLDQISFYDTNPNGTLYTYYFDIFSLLYDDQSTLGREIFDELLNSLNSDLKDIYLSTYSIASILNTKHIIDSKIGAIDNKELGNFKLKVSDSYRITNSLNYPIFANLMAYGYTKEPLTSKSQGLKLSKSYYKEPIDNQKENFDQRVSYKNNSAINVNDIVVVNLKLSSTSFTQGKIILKDTIPSGFEFVGFDNNSSDLANIQQAEDQIILTINNANNCLDANECNFYYKIRASLKGKVHTGFSVAFVQKMPQIRGIFIDNKVFNIK